MSNRTSLLKVRLTPEERAALDEAARLSSLDLSAYVRHALSLEALPAPPVAAESTSSPSPMPPIPNSHAEGDCQRCGTPLTVRRRTRGEIYCLDCAAA